MLDAVIDWSLRHRALVLLGALALILGGGLSLARLPLDAFPDTTPVQVQVNTRAPALTPLEVERQLTLPLEQALLGLPGLVEQRSLSTLGLSQITLQFADGTDLDRARQRVSERLLAVELPPGASSPALGPVSTGLGEVFHYLVTGAGRSQAELRRLQERLIAPALRAVPGVAEVNSWGGEERRIELLLDPVKLQRAELGLVEVAEVLARGGRNVSGGLLEAGGASTLVQGVGALTRPAQLDAFVVATREGVPVRVRDLGRVVEGRALRTGAVTADGRGEVVLGLGFARVGESGDGVSRALALRLDEVRRTLPAGVEVTPVYQRSWLVGEVLSTAGRNLIEGAALVIVVLLLFLGGLRAGLVVAVVIPISVLVAAIGMAHAGVAASLLSLGALDFGLVVDSAVIQIENATRRLAHREDLRSQREIIRDAVLEVRKPTLFGELIIIAVYLPVLALGGVEGKLFRPMALTVVFALLGSLALSLTVVPVLASLVLPRHPTEREPILVRGAKWLYRPVLRWVLDHPKWILLAALLTLANAMGLAARLGGEFVPRLREGALVANTIRLAGVSLDESVRYGGQIERHLLAAFPDEIAHIWSRTGTAEIATDPMGVELTDVFLTLTPRAQWTRASTQEELVEAMRSSLDGFPGMRVAFSQPIEMRVSEMLAGIRSDLGVTVYGDDLATLKRLGREVEAVLRELPGAVDVTAESSTGRPLLQVELDRDACGRYGVSPEEVLQAVEALGGIPAGELREQTFSVPVVVRLPESFRQQPNALGRLLVASRSGGRVPLSRVARLSLVETPATVQRERGQRRVVVQANPAGRDVEGFVEEAQREIARRVALPAGYSLRFGGQFEQLQEAKARLSVVIPLALCLVFGLLYATYGNATDAARVFTGVPFAAVGGVVALWLRDIPFSVSAGVGFVALSGVAVLGDMVMVSTIRQHLAEGRPVREAVEHAALQRLRPVLMTALVASVGFVPMAFHTGIGAEVQRPLATVVIGGIVSSTVLTLLVLPTLYAWASRPLPTSPRAS